MLVPDTLIYTGHFLPTKSNKGTRHLSQHSSSDTPRYTTAPDTHSATPPHIDLYDWYWQIHPYGNGTSQTLIRGGDQVKTRQREEENESLGDFTFLLTVPILSSHWHWLQPITNSNVIMSSNSADQRLYWISVLNWFPEDSEELFDMKNAKTSRAYPSLPLIHGMMLRLSPVSRLEKHTYTRRSAVSYPYVSPECLYGH